MHRAQPVMTSALALGMMVVSVGKVLPFLVMMRLGVTPVPIPNTMVKT